MYRKYYRNDELYTNIYLFFSLFILSGLLVYKEYANPNHTWNIPFFIITTSILFLIFIYSVIYYLVNSNYKQVDFAIDFLEHSISLNNYRKKLKFDDVEFYAYLEKTERLTLLVKNKLYSFQLSQLLDKDDNPLDSSRIDELKEHIREVKMRHLFNYNLMLTMLLVIGLFFYSFMGAPFILFGINMSAPHVTIFAFIIYLVSLLLRRLHYNMVKKEKEKF